MRIGLLFVLLLFLTSSAFGQVSPWTGSWVWNDSPTSVVYFRKAIDIAGGIKSAKISITADDAYTLYVNGTTIGSGDDWKSVNIYDITSYLAEGCNIIAVKAEDPSAEIGALLVEGSIATANDGVTLFGTDDSWKMSIDEKPGWKDADFDDSSWKSPKVIGKPPVGPWGGMVHPDIAPKVALNTADVDWPKSAKPGDTIDVVCKVRSAGKISSDIPVALRLLQDGEAVCEQWIQPSTLTSDWKPGEEQILVFKGFRLPAYVPTGTHKAQVVSTLTEASGGIDVTVGPIAKKIPPVSIQITGFKVTPSNSDNNVLRVGWKCDQSQNTLFYFVLMKGREMWFASNVTSDQPEVHLPKDFPGGAYEARLMPHGKVCGNVPIINISVKGPSSTTLKPLGYGEFVDNAGVPHKWHVNQAGTLIWDGKPYIPGGGMYLSRFFMDYTVNAVERNEAALEDDIQRLTALKKAGITDIYLNPCAGWKSRPVWVWQRFIDLCEEMGFYYGIQVTQEVGRLNVFDTISDQFNADIKGGETAYTDIPNTLLTAISPKNIVYYAAFDSTGGNLIDSGAAKVTEAKNGVRAEARPKAADGQKITVHFTPEYVQMAGIHDYWNGVNSDFQKDLDEFFSAIKPGPNFRFWIDPLDNEQSFTIMGYRFLPNSSEFRKAFADHLKVSGEAPRTWALNGVEIDDPAMYARIIPIGKASQDSKLAYMLDPDTGKTYSYDPSKSTMWADMLDFRDNSVADFNYDAAEAIKKYHCAPVVLKHEKSDLFRNKYSFGGFDGLGAESYGTDRKHLKETSIAVNWQSNRSGHTMWQLTTETGLSAAFVGYPTPIDMMKDFISMLEMGGKGTYAFLFKDASGSPYGDWYTYNLFEDPRQLHWLGCYARLIKSANNLVDYIPGPDATADTPDINSRFLKDILGLNIMDLGPTFQAVNFSNNTYIWNLKDQDCSLGLDYNASADSAYIRCPDGRYIKALKNACTLLPTVADAKCPVIIERSSDPIITGSNAANLRSAMREWKKLNEKIKAAGLPVKPEFASKDWRDVFKENEKLRKQTGDIFAPQMQNIIIDGDLQEWKNADPLYLKKMWDVDVSKYDDARFYVSYDSDYLYIAGDIKDNTIVNNNQPDKLWNGDAAEVFIDLEPYVDTKNPAYTNNCFQFIFAPSDIDGKPATAVINPALPAGSIPVNSRLAAATNDTGWTFEAAISKADLNNYKIEPGKVIGFNLQLDNSDGQERVWSKIWRGTDEAFKNRLGFGRLLLGGYSL